MAGTIGASGKGVRFMVAAGIVYEIVAAACSSPQTTEINASARSDTLMKWVYLGLGQAAVFIVIAAAIEPDGAVPIVAGGTLAGAIMYASYIHANKAGLASGAPGTEDYSEGGSNAVQEYSQA
jgi:hypothetical protein